MAHLNDIVTISRVTYLDTEWSTEKKRWPSGRTTAKRNWVNPLRSLKIECDGITLTEYNALRDHFDDMSGSYGTFTVTDTHEAVTYTVRFADDTLRRRPVRPNVAGLYRITFDVEEDKS